MEKIEHNEPNLLDLIPVKTVEWEKNGDGTIFLKVPKVKSPFFQQVIAFLGKSPYYKVQLDEFGSHVWENCNGEYRVEQIAENLRQKFGEKVEPVYERLGAFVKVLASQKFIVYKGMSKR